MKLYLMMAAVVSIIGTCTGISACTESSTRSCIEGEPTSHVNGTCLCLNNPMRDRCTFLPKVGSCCVQRIGSDAAATATYQGSLLSSYHSCVANDNCNNEVHVIASFGNSNLNSRTVARSADVFITVTGSSSRRLILVLSSFWPAQWILHIPSGVIIDTVILSSFYDSSISAQPGQVLAVENILRYYYSSGFGGIDRSLELLTSIYEQFGSLSSFTATRLADEWRLTIARQDLACTPSVVPPPPASTPAPFFELGLFLGANRCQGQLGVSLGISLGVSSSNLGLACNLNITDREAMVICRQLSCIAQGAQRVNANQFSSPSSDSRYIGGLTAVFNTYTCRGSESSLRSCEVGLPVCRASQQASFIGIICGSNDPVTTPKMISVPPTTQAESPSTTTTTTTFSIILLDQFLEGTTSLQQQQLSLAERQCIADRISSSSRITQCLTTFATVESLCGNSVCVRELNVAFLRCTSTILDRVCEMNRATEPNNRVLPTSGGSPPRAIWYGVGFGIAAIFIVVITVLYFVARNRIQKTRSRSSNPSSRSSPRSTTTTRTTFQRAVSSLTTSGRTTAQPVYHPPPLPPSERATVQPGLSYHLSAPPPGGDGGATLYTDAPPSYDELQANKDHYADVTLPPPYTGRTELSVN